MTAAEAIRILIVEEERIIALDLRAALEELGYCVVGIAATSDEALAKAAEGKPHIALMDIRIKGPTDGIQTAALLRKQQDLPVVYLTANADDNTLARAKLTEPAGYLVKPYNPRSLHTTIQVALLRCKMINEVLTEANTDALTGLANRRHFDKFLPEQLELCERKGQALGLMMLDVDNFKKLNDTHGHPLGDKALQALASYLRDHLRDGDVACRYGGEEFAIVVPGASLFDAMQLAERLRAGVERLEIATESTTLTITASFGVAAFPAHGVEPAQLLHAADGALYRAKLAGRNRVAAASL